MNQQPPQGNVPPQQQAPGRAVAQAPHGSLAQPGSGPLLFEGIAKHSSRIGAYIKWTLVSLVAGGIAILVKQMGWSEAWGMPGWALGLFWLAGIPGLLVTYLIHTSTRYKVTGRRVEIESGVLAKQVETLELWRVLDVQYTQSLVDRIFKNGRIKLISTDQTNPQLVLHGLPEHRQLFEQLRDAVQDARQSNRPMELVPGSNLDGVGEMIG